MLQIIYSIKYFWKVRELEESYKYVGYLIV